MKFLEKFHGRKKAKDDVGFGDLIVLKTPFSPQIRRIGIRKAFDELLRSLRAYVGEDFLATTKFTVAYPVNNNMFLMTNGLNYVKEDCQLRLRCGEDEGVLSHWETTKCKVR